MSPCSERTTARQFLDAQCVWVPGPCECPCDDPESELAGVEGAALLGAESDVDVEDVDDVELEVDESEVAVDGVDEPAVVLGSDLVPDPRESFL